MSHVRFYAWKVSGNHNIVNGAKMLDSTSVDVTMVNLFTYRVFVTGVSKNLLYFITVLVTVLFWFFFFVTVQTGIWSC
jgi:hypothetical protein